MGYKRALIGLGAAARRASREADRADRAVQREAARGLRRVDASADRTIKLAEAFEHRLGTNPIAAMDLRYVEQQGLMSTPFELQTEGIVGRIYLIEPRERRPPTLIFDGPTCKITLLDLRAAFFGTVMALRIDNLHPTHRVKLGWFKKSKPGESPVFLVDEGSGQYYYPKASDLVGEVVPGQSRIGLMVFDPFRLPTEAVQVHFSSVVVGPAKETATFALAHRSAQLGQDIHAIQATPRFIDRVRSEVQRLARGQALAIQSAAAQTTMRRRSAGCLGCALPTLATLGLLVVAMAWVLLG